MAQAVHGWCTSAVRSVHYKKGLNVEYDSFVLIKVKQFPGVCRLEVFSISRLTCPSAKDIKGDIVSNRLQQIVILATFLLLSFCIMSLLSSL